MSAPAIIAIAVLLVFLTLLGGSLARIAAKPTPKLPGGHVPPKFPGKIAPQDPWPPPPARLAPDDDPRSGSFDSLGDLRIYGRRLYSLTLYRDGSGEYTFSDRERDDLPSYGGTDA